MMPVCRVLEDAGGGEVGLAGVTCDPADFATNFRELRYGEVHRIVLPGTSMNKVRREKATEYNPATRKPPTPKGS
jgi:hypothetical protein